MKKYYFSSEIDDFVRLEINSIFGPFKNNSEKRGILSMCSDEVKKVYLGVRKCNVEVSITDSLNNRISQRILVFNKPVNQVFKELVEFPVKFRDLPEDCYLVMTLFKSIPIVQSDSDLEAEDLSKSRDHFFFVEDEDITKSQDHVIGGTSIRLFGGNNMEFLSGQRSLRVWKCQQGHPKCTPGELEYVSERSMDGLSLIHRSGERTSSLQHPRNTFSRNAWIDKKYWTTIEKKLGKLSERNIIITLNLSQSPGGISILFVSPVKKNPSLLIEEEEDDYNDDSSSSSTFSQIITVDDDFYDSKKEFGQITMFSPFERTPIQNMYHQLSQRKVLLEQDRKRTPETDEEIRKLLKERLLKKTVLEELSQEEKNLIWKYRYYLMTTRTESIVKIIYSATTNTGELLGVVEEENEGETEEEEEGDEIPSSKFGKFVHTVAREKRQKMFMFRIDRKKRSELLFEILPKIPLWILNELGVSDALELLSYRYENEPKIREFAIRKILQKMTNKEIFSILLQLVQSLHYETASFEISKSPLGKFLILRSTKCFEIASYLFWYLKVEVINSDEKVFQHQLSAFLYSILQNLSTENQQSLGRQTRFFKEIKGLATSMKKRYDEGGIKMDQLNKDFRGELLKIRNEDFFPFPSHINPKIIITGIEAAKCKIFSSNTKPLCLAFRIERNNDDEMLYRMIFKVGDDLRQDMLILQTIRFMDSMLKRNHLDLKVTPSRAIPCDLDSGFIEFISNNFTIEEITKAQPKEGKTIITKSILPFLASKRWCEGKELWDEETSPDHQRKEYKNMKYRFRKSCAAYCVVSYVLGFGDRHLDNILVLIDGRMVHIDFGFILGEKPTSKFFAPTIKLTKEMKEGMDCKSFGNFLEDAAQAYSVFRSNARLFINMYVMMIDSKIPPIVPPSERFNEKILFQGIHRLLENLQVKKDNYEAGWFIAKEIMNNYDTWGGMIENWAHTWAKARK